jgi:hypothetical protein
MLIYESFYFLNAKYKIRQVTLITEGKTPHLPPSSAALSCRNRPDPSRNRFGTRPALVLQSCRVRIVVPR